MASGAALAPMAGVADRAFREICREFGAVYTVTEMVSAKGLLQGGKKTKDLMVLGEGEHPAAVQLFGDDPEVLSRAAEAAMEASPDVIDLNMGCPAPKIAGNRAGSALMKDLGLASKIIRAVKNASPVPVTVKFRKGWDDASVNAVEFAQMAQESGADAVTVHGRTRAQMYAPPADWEIIGRVKAALTIPVIGNGDVDSPQAAKKLLEETGCDLVMVGRGALGRPWLFSQIAAYLRDGTLLPDPPAEERMAVMCRHIRRMAEYKGEYIGFREARKHCGWYITGIRGAAALRRRAGAIQSMEDVESLAKEVIGQERAAAMEKEKGDGNG